MAAQQTPPDAAGASTSGAFEGIGSSLGFFQDWLKAAGSALPNLQGSVAPNWSMPTLDPQELDKRIQDLRTVQFWLEQNARMIAMTIQGLEVQKMTLSTLKDMNVSMDALRDSLQARSSETAPQPEATAAQADLINPMRWWDTLTQQFGNLAAQATQAAQSVDQSKATKPRKAAAKASPRKKAASPRSGSGAGAGAG